MSQGWTDAFSALSDEMWSLIKILQATLNDDDARWLAFGLPMPATPSTPGQPVDVAAHTDGTGAIIVQCAAVALATRYRCRMLIVGVETDYRLAASGTEPLLSIAGVLPGQTVQLIVQAVNGSLQGVASVPIQFTVPLASAKGEEAKSAAATERAAVKVHTNGNGHGHSNGRSLHARTA